MKKNSLLAFLVMCGLLMASVGHAQSTSSKPILDDLINWSDPFALPQQKLTGILDAGARNRGTPIYTTSNNSTAIDVYLDDAKKVSLKNNLLGISDKVVRAYFTYYPNGRLSQLSFTITKDGLTKKKISELGALLSQKTGDASPAEVKNRYGRPATQWTNAKFIVQLADSGENYVKLIILPSAP